jgi:hypothetical protein
VRCRCSDQCIAYINYDVSPDCHDDTNSTRQPCSQAQVLVGTLGACCLLAKEIIDAGERVVLNHERCRCLVARVNSLLPHLQLLGERQQTAAAKGWVLLPLCWVKLVRVQAECSHGAEVQLNSWICRRTQVQGRRRWRPAHTGHA